MEIKELFENVDMSNNFNQAVYDYLTNLNDKLDKLQTELMNAKENEERIRKAYNDRFFNRVEENKDEKEEVTLPVLNCDILMDAEKYREFKKMRKELQKNE